MFVENYRLDAMIGGQAQTAIPGSLRWHGPDEFPEVMLAMRMAARAHLG